MPLWSPSRGWVADQPDQGAAAAVGVCVGGVRQQSISMNSDGNASVSAGDHSEDDDVIELEGEVSSAAAAAAAADDAADAADADPPFLWSASDIDESEHTIDTSFAGGIYDYFVVIEREGSLYGHCRLTKLQIKRGRKFKKESNSNLWALLRSSFPKFAERLKGRKQQTGKAPAPLKPAAVAMAAWRATAKDLGVRVCI